jgi:hypothetical protein
MRQSGQYWVKIKWPTAVNEYTWVVGLWNDHLKVWRTAYWKDNLEEGLLKGVLLEVDENMLVYSPQQTKQYEWPTDRDVNDDDLSAWAVCKSLKNIGEILQDIHQQLVISNQKQ